MHVLAFVESFAVKKASVARISLFVTFLCSACLMSLSGVSHAGHWISPVCYGQDFPVRGDTTAAGLSSALQRRACVAPSSTILAIKETIAPSVCVNTRWGIAAASFCAIYYCDGGIKSSDNFCFPATRLTSINSCSVHKANPVEVANGRKVQTTVDWTSAGTNPFVFSRSYSSFHQLAGAPPYSRLGNGWRSNFDSRAKYSFSTGVPNQQTNGDMLHIVLANSNEYSFKLVSGTWKPVIPRPNPLLVGTVIWDQYRTDLDFSLAFTADSVEFRSESGDKYTYDIEGRLSKIAYPTGYSQYLSYAGKYNTGITDSNGRLMTFEYFSDSQKNGLMKSVNLPDGKKISFGYVDPAVTNGLPPFDVVAPERSPLQLATVIYPDATPATDADNPKLNYEYLQSLEFPNALTGIYDERGIKHGAWTYDAQGRATSSQHGGGNDLTTFNYDDVNNKVTVTNPLGRSTVYQYQREFGVLQKLLSVDGVVTTNCAASNTAYTYDANGFRNQATDAEGRITKWVRNSRGLATSTTEGFGSPAARTTTTTWDATRPLPTQIAAPGLTTNIAYNAASQVTSLSQVDTTTTTIPYSTNGQTRTTAFNYTSMSQPAPPAIAPSGTPLSDVTLSLTNPGAETGTTAGWTNSIGAIAVQTTTPCNVSKCFTGGTVASSAAHQDIPIPAANTAEVDASKRAAKVSWKQNSSQYTDRAAMRLLFLNQSGTVIGSAVDDVRAEATWSLRERTAPIPALTRTIRVQMIMERTSGTPNDGYVDDIALSLVADGSAAAKPYLRPANTDALSGNITGWTVSVGSVATQTTAPCTVFACFKDVNAGNDSFHQTITLPTDRLTEIDGLARGLELQWIDRATDIANLAAVEMTFLNSADQPIAGGTSTSPAQASLNLWKQRLHYADIPTGARKVKIAVYFNQPVSSTGGTFFTGLTARLVGRNVPQASIDMLTSVDGPLAGTGDTVFYQYDTKGNITLVTDELGHTTQITALNATGQPLTIVDENGVTTTMVYDARGRLITVTVNPGAAQAVTAIEYDLAGQVTKVTAPDGSFLAYTWSDAKRLTLITNNTGETVAYGYNLNGDETSATVKSSGGAVTRQMTMVYDELGRLMRSIGAASQTTTVAYDRTDNPVSVSDPRSNLYAYAYDGLSRLMRETDQEGAQVNLTRDGQDEITTYADPRSLATTYVRNGFGEVIRETSPDAGVTTYVRDLRGLITQVTDGRGIVANYANDNAGRVTSVSYPAATAENVTYTYDSIAGGNKGIGRLTGITDQSGSTAYTYDALGRITAETRIIGSKAYSSSYAYDAADHVIQITYPSGRIVSYARNSLGQVASVTTKQNAGSAAVNVATGVAWKPMSDLLGAMTHGNGLQTAAGYDLDYRLTSLAVQDGASTLSSLAYAYADGMNLTAVNDNLAPANSAALGYSPANRLQNATGNWGAASYSYDGVGNRLSQSTTLAAVTSTRLSSYDPVSNRITGMTENSATLRSYTYDNGGNIVTDTRPGEVFGFSYNARNRPSSVTRNGVPYASYSYNAFEQLVARSTSAPGGPVGTIHYIHDLDGHIIAEADASTGATSREYIWMAANDNYPTDLPLAVAEGASLYMIHTDHLGRPVKMTDAAKATVWQAAYNPYGEATSLSGTVALNLRFRGQVFQIETGLAYNWHRHYDPITGRYTQPDPLRFVDGPSIYAYAGNSPFMYTDREGKKIIGAPSPYSPGYGTDVPPGNGTGGGRNWRDWFPNFSPPRLSPSPGVCTLDDDYALKSCLAAAEGDEDAWVAYCGASGFSPPVDFTRPAKCYQKTHESKISRQNWCHGEFGD